MNAELLKRADLMLSCWSLEEVNASGRLSLVLDMRDALAQLVEALKSYANARDAVRAAPDEGRELDEAVAHAAWAWDRVLDAMKAA